MTSPRKKLDDDHYPMLLDGLMIEISKELKDIVKPSSPRLPSKSISARVIYHRLMLRLIDTLCPTDLTVKAEVIKYHQQLIEGDLTHRHPKNLLSEILTAKMDKQDSEIEKQVRVLELTIPLDGEVPAKLIKLLSTFSECTSDFWFAFEHAYVSLLNEVN